ncbi:UNVERIFIED_CONTAM: spermatogenesis associated protein 5 [Siphonaria sp. JEL0065]|nr:spermatogenesis associated protein 5 [Siphonaria sp. JEL0065]
MSTKKKSSAKKTPTPKGATSPIKASPTKILSNSSLAQVQTVDEDDLIDFQVLDSSSDLNPWRVVISPLDAIRRKLKAGEVVHIGPTGGIGVVWLSANVDRKTISMSSQLRVNLGIQIGSSVTLEKLKVNIHEITKLVLRPTTQGLDSLWIDDVLQILAKEMLRDSKYVMKDGIVEFMYQGKNRQFRAEAIKLNEFAHENDSSHPTIFQFTHRSDITVLPFQSNTEKKRWGSTSKISYDSIGGLAKQMETIRKLVEVPLLDPQRFAKYGIRPPRGVLLYGAPGTGKTLIARAIAAETGAHVIVINGPEIISKFYGETEERLRSIFEEAQENAPSIIFIDEIDSLCPKRDDNATDLEKRIVSTLLTLMDGTDSKAQSSDGVIVLAATNRPNTLDDALRRPGRFDREIEIGIPDAHDRVLILRALLRKTPHCLTDEQVRSIAGDAHGYVGADLAGVVREAGMCALKRVTAHVVDNVRLENVIVTVEDVKVGLGRVKPSSMREVLLEVPNVRWTDIGGQEEIKQRIQEAVEWPLKHPEAFERFKIRPPKGILMYGPPGCSKTLMAKALATEAGLNFLAVKGPELFSKWVGESEKAIRDIFKKARAASPSVIFFDEIDSIAVRRGNDNGSVSDRVLSQLLNEMDGIEPLINVTVIAATNRPDILDSALLRPGRMDRILYVSPPDFESRLQIFKIKSEKMACSPDVDCEEFARLTDGYSGAEVVSVCQEAAMYAMEEDVDIEFVSRRHFLQAIESVTPRITKEMIEFYDRFRLQSGLRILILAGAISLVMGQAQYCSDASNSICVSVKANDASQTYDFTVQSAHAGYASIGLGATGMVGTTMVVGWLKSNNDPLVSIRRATAHHLPPVSDDASISQIKVDSTTLVGTPKIAFAFSLMYSSAQKHFKIENASGGGSVDFIYAVSDNPPDDRDAGDSGFGYHLKRDSFPLLIPAQGGASVVSSSPTVKTSAVSSLKHHASSATHSVSHSASTSTKPPSVTANPHAGKGSATIGAPTQYCYDKQNTFCLSITYDNATLAPIYTVKSTAEGWVGVGVNSLDMFAATMFIGWKNSQGNYIISKRTSNNEVQPQMAQDQTSFVRVATPSTVAVPQGLGIVFSFMITDKALAKVAVDSTNYIFGISSSPVDNIDQASSTFDMHTLKGIFNLAAPSLGTGSASSVAPSPSPNNLISLPSSLSSSIFCNGDSSFCISATRNLSTSSVDVTVLSTYKGWAAFGIGTSMASSSIFVGWMNSNGKPVVSEREGAPYLQPPMASMQHLNLVQNPANISESSSIAYTIQIPTSLISTTGATSFIYALSQSKPSNPDSATSNFIQHSVTGSFSLDVSKAGSSTGIDGPSKPNFVLYHGICMFLAWCICPSAAIFIARYLKNKLGHLWYKLHVGIMFAGVGLLMALGLLFIELSLADGIPSFSGSTVHGIIGITVAFGLYPVQIVLGYVSNHLFSMERKAIPWWDKMHW